MLDEDVFIQEVSDKPLPAGALKELLQAVLQRKRSFRFRARGRSMAPFIRDGDIVTVAPIAEAPLRLGDVVAFLTPEEDRLTLHRLVARQGEAWMLQGDNLQFPDGLVPQQSILGRVTGIARRGRSIHWGLGPERGLLALLSRLNLLLPLRRLMRPALHLLRRGSPQRCEQKAEPSSEHPPPKRDANHA
jgi:hypothetical protein